MARPRPAARITTGFTSTILAEWILVYRAGRHQHANLDGARRGLVSGGKLTAHLSDGSAADYVDSTGAGEFPIRSQLHLDLQCRICGTDVEDQLGDDFGVRQRDVERSRAFPRQPKHYRDGGNFAKRDGEHGVRHGVTGGVTNGSDSPLSGVTVTFTAPGTGAGANFSGSSSVTAVTNANGIATAPALTANGQTGSYTVTATAVGVASATSFSLTNLPGPPASVTATAGTSQSATVNTAFGTALQAVVKNSGNNLLSGVTVTFTAPATGASSNFGGSASVTAITNASGIATALGLTANGQAGGYTITASVVGVATAASFSLTNTAATTASGTLIGSGNSATTTDNLTAEGTADWVHWGDPVLNRKSGVSPQIGNYSVVGIGTRSSLHQRSAGPELDGWHAHGQRLKQLRDLHRLPAEWVLVYRAGRHQHANLTVHVGGWWSGGKLTAHLSDGSAADFVDSTAQVNVHTIATTP